MHTERQAPLIVSAELDAGTARVLDGLRQRHFPRGANHLRAHLTLFHHLPGDAADEAGGLLAATASSTAPLPGRLAPPRSLGRGVAFGVEALSLWRYLGGPWKPLGSWPLTGPG